MGRTRMAPLIRQGFDTFKEVEKLLKSRFWDKERERSNRAHGLHEAAYGAKRRCPLRHQRIAWSGPPHDKIRCYICLDCNAAASEPEIKDRGMDFDTVPDFIIHAIFDADLERQAAANSKPFSFGGSGDKRGI